MSGRVVSVRLGRARTMPRPAWDHNESRTWTSAFIKDEVAGPVRIGPLGLDGDEQANLRVHGGPHRAVLAYGAGRYPAWREELGLADMGPGAFAENLTLEGWDETSVCVGDRFEIGSAVLEVSQPRGPCANISRRWDRADMVERVERHAWSGWYHRVIASGAVAIGDRVTRIANPHPEWTVERVFRYSMGDRDDAAGLRALVALEPLSPGLRERFARRIPAGA